ncbi:rhodanese-like domain-containing protein [Apiospora saccharicola]|uniref:M-phase inducer phosphatase n=1 Tax=Apiospora saccharicola TaxID=335842 RepID=A0ABR1WHY8_9PEZI
MDASSPLAAMHPAPPPTWGQSHDIYRSHSHYSNSNPFGSALNIRDHLQRSKPDYFSLKNARGSSPTASLAADLSQNFRIDTEGSPRFPTPRRALFTSNVMGGIEGREYITTPPLPASSSPVPMSVGDMMEMDISPLPHKCLYPNASIQITSPTPGEMIDDDDDDDSMMMESPIALSRPPSMTTLEPPKPLITDSRKRLALRRPSLSRTKGHSASGITGRSHAENQMSAFRFGSQDRVPSGLSLGECFQDSPPQLRRPQTATSPDSNEPASLRPKPQFASLTGTRNGSPISSHSRRPSNPFNRRPRQYRRSLSMFENPADIVKPKKEEPVPASGLQSVMDIEDVQDPALPHFFPEGDNECSIPRISRETFLDVMDGKYSQEYTQRLVIDCRFEYEYEGGHIDGAINYNDKELLARHLFEQPMEGKVLLIFHCEYSAHRAPLMARHIRAEDRTVNAEHYPRLTYPEVYLLDGGYSEFFIEHPARCYPQSYVEMNDSEHVMTCEREMGKLQQKRKGLSRARTFAFGARESMVDESPTAPGRCHDSPGSMIGNSPILGVDRTSTRRMASY